MAAAAQITLIRYLGQLPIPTEPDPVYRIRPSDRGDLDQLGELYFRSYEPGQACDTPEEAVADVAASFQGGYGPFAFDLSPIAVVEDAIVAALMTVEMAPWHDTPSGPFIIELFTDRRHRRKGLARSLLERCMIGAADAGHLSVALQVMDDNRAAMSLYRSLDFERWTAGPG